MDGKASDKASQKPTSQATVAGGANSATLDSQGRRSNSKRTSRAKDESQRSSFVRKSSLSSSNSSHSLSRHSSLRQPTSNRNQVLMDHHTTVPQENAAPCNSPPYTDPTGARVVTKDSERDPLCKLTFQFPDLANDIVQAVLDSHQGNFNQAFVTLCDMVVDPSFDEYSEDSNVYNEVEEELMYEAFCSKSNERFRDKIKWADANQGDDSETIPTQDTPTIANAHTKDAADEVSSGTDGLAEGPAAGDLSGYWKQLNLGEPYPYLVNPKADTLVTAQGSSGSQSDASDPYQYYNVQQAMQRDREKPTIVCAHGNISSVPNAPKQKGGKYSFKGTSLGFQEFHQVTHQGQTASVWNLTQGGGFRLSAKEKSGDLFSKYGNWASQELIEDLLLQLNGDTEQVELTLLDMLPTDDVPAFAGNPNATSSHTRHNPARTTSNKDGYQQTSPSNEAAISNGSALSVPDKTEGVQFVNKLGLSGVQRVEFSQAYNHLLVLRSQSKAYIRMLTFTKNQKSANTLYEIQDEYQKAIWQCYNMLIQYVDTFGIHQCLDLHGLLVHEAVLFAKAKLVAVNRARLEGKNPPRKITLVCGRGNNSGKRGAKIRPAIENLLQEQGLRYSKDNADGAIIVEVTR